MATLQKTLLTAEEREKRIEECLTASQYKRSKTSGKWMLQGKELTTMEMATALKLRINTDGEVFTV